MAIRLKLGNYETVQGDVLDRWHIGYFPRMTEPVAREADQGVWRMSAEKVARQKFALLVGEGLVRAIGEFTSAPLHGDRIAHEGHGLEAGHPVRDAYFNKPDPVDIGSPNRVGYCELPEKEPYLYGLAPAATRRPATRTSCLDTKSVPRQARVRQLFDGSPLRFIEWVDGVLASTATEPGTRR